MIFAGTRFLVCYTVAVEVFVHFVPITPLIYFVARLMSEFAAANTASMILFVGKPKNVVICEGFGIESTAFTG